MFSGSIKNEAAWRQTGNGGLVLFLAQLHKKLMLYHLQIDKIYNRNKVADKKKIIKLKCFYFYERASSGTFFI